MKQPDFLHVDTNLLKLKVDQKFFGWAWVWPVGTLKLTVSQEQTDGINRFFFACWCNFRKAKSYFSDFSVSMFKNGCDYFIH